MKNGYKILWTNHALSELQKTIKYLEDYWTEGDVANFAVKLENTILLLSRSPKIFPKSDVKEGIRRVIVAKHNTLYYKIVDKNIIILSLFSHRQDPSKKKLK